MTAKKIIPTSSFPPAVLNVPGIGLFRRPMFPPYELPISAADHLIGLGYAVEDSGEGCALPTTPPAPAIAAPPVVEPEPVAAVAEERPDPLNRIVDYLQSSSLEDLKSSLKGRLAEKRLEAIKEGEIVTPDVVLENLTSSHMDLLAELTQAK